jgi:glutamyl-tRNA synthetase
MHIGNFFQMFISYNLTRVTDGTFFLRVEDTDAKREKKDATKVIYDILDRFNIKPDEYQTLDGEDIGEYGPYVQSQRADIYEVYAKKLVSEGKAFPCFCKKTEGKEDVLKLREEKFAEDDEKEYDPCRDLSYEQVKANLDAGMPFAIRLKTKNDGTQRIKFFDLIKGEIEAKANAKDFIILKTDGIPPYAFAHAVDDTLMGTTIVVRGEEYISSVPAHIELFEALGFDLITYCHNPLICKIGDNGNRRKISKRYDPEADMRFYFEEGYPTTSVLEYLLNIINSGFESYLAAQLDYLFSYIDYHRAEDVGAYVRLCQIHYVIAGPGIPELGEDLSDESVLYAGRELAVRESARAALAKEHVGLWIEHSVSFEAFNSFSPGRHGRSSFEDQRAIARLRELKSREEPCRPHADHHRPRAQFLLTRLGRS